MDIWKVSNENSTNAYICLNTFASNGEYICRYVRPGIVQFDFSENMLNLLLKCNEIISIWLIDILVPQNTLFRGSFCYSRDWQIHYFSIHIPKIQKVYALPDLIFTKYHWICWNWLKSLGERQLELVILKNFVLIREVQWKYIHAVQGCHSFLGNTHTYSSSPNHFHGFPKCISLQLVDYGEYIFCMFLP